MRRRPLRAPLAGARAAEYLSHVLVAFHKPYGVISRFTRDAGAHRTLAEFGLPPRVYPIGRLDADSEGLLLLTDEAALVSALLEPDARHPRVYQAQIEGVPGDAVLARLARGVVVQGRRTRPCEARRLASPPAFAPRVPPVRIRRTVPDCWIELVLTEGRNRQVRRMTAAIGHPTLRLVRVAIGRLALGDLAPGAWRSLDERERSAALASGAAARRRRGPGRRGA